ncbi:MAG TPA: PQQ-binding-like beta-propeller repeat protein [Bryobacteraceae bacterium]|nr:PQQ-binding-like beta-propeller repeat protein [Bryobacteraceae bacterium]
MRRLWLLSLLVAPALLPAADWTDYRGPNRDGKSPEKNLVNDWSLDGRNLLWKAPYGSRSTPVVFGDRVYLFNSSGKEDTVQERLMCFDANTGKVLWEYHNTVFHSDAPAHRIAWSAPAVDPETGNVYVFGVDGHLIAVDKNGKKVWDRSLNEELGYVSTHGGRTVSPVVEGDLVVVSAITSAWGENARAGHRYAAYDKKTGAMVWLVQPGQRPYDTTYSPPVVAEIDGQKLLIAGGGDGAVHAMQVNTGKKVWSLPYSKRGINTGVAVDGNMVFFSQSEENLEDAAMGLIAGLDGTKQGELKISDLKWKNYGPQMGYSNPLVADGVYYQIDNSANLFAYDTATGKELWKQNLGNLQKASPVWADGKIYVGTESGVVYIIKVGREKAEILSKVKLGEGGESEIIVASPAISEGRIFVVSEKAMYVFGKPSRLGTARNTASKGVAKAAPIATKVAGLARSVVDKPAQLQVVPVEVILRPGQAVDFTVRAFDEKGNFLKNEKAEWSTTMKGSIGGTGQFTADAETRVQAGKVTAKVGEQTVEARVRVLPVVPLGVDFEMSKAEGPPPPFWVNALGKYQVRDMEGSKVLAKLADNAFTKRARTFFGHTNEHDYTVEADIRAIDKRRQMGDAGVVAQRYALTLYGNHQRLEIQPWQAEPKRTASVDFPWKKDTWYHMKLRVENLPNGAVRAQGKVWPVGEAEPAKWTIEKIDPVGSREGAPGIYADAANEVFFDNIKAVKN